MAGDDDRFVSHRSNVYFGGLDHPVDVSAGRIVDERINAVPAGIAAMNNVRFRDRDGYEANRQTAWNSGRTRSNGAMALRGY
jgi:hypothetical protein